MKIYFKCIPKRVMLVNNNKDALNIIIEEIARQRDLFL
jgi:hypothetical protein